MKAGYYVSSPYLVSSLSGPLMTEMQGVLNHYFAPSDNAGHPVPVDILVTGSVPAGSGLSSSAAMVVASTLAFLAVNGKLDDTASAANSGLNKGKLVEMSMENEKRVGVNSGGCVADAFLMIEQVMLTRKAEWIKQHP